MVPASILYRLTLLATRERLVRLAWGAARLVAAVGVLLLVAGLTDWVYDRFADTPWWLRYGLAGLQVVVAAGLLFWLVVRPLFQSLPYSYLAAWVEKTFPQLRGRVRSAVELNAAGADTAGMSQELIAETTRQAVEQMKQVPLGEAIDGRRWAWSAEVVAPVALTIGVLWLIAPATCAALFQRQLLAEVEIPRGVQLAATGRSIWPTGDEIQLQFRATGPGAEFARGGTVVIQGEGLPREVFALEPVATGGEGQVFQATIPSPGASFQAWAWVSDGRTKSPTDVTLEPRPDLVASQAWLVLPAYVGTRPDGGVYEELQERGDIVGFRGCTARIDVTANKPLGKAVLEILGPEADSPGERVVRALPMDPADQDGVRWSRGFDLQPGETAYRIQMADRHGYENRKIPRRSITLLPDEPPVVTLLPDRFPGDEQKTFLEDSEVDGLPVLFGRAIRIGYRARTNLALAKAVLRYRILKPGSEGRVESIPWTPLPLVEVLPTAEAGPFDLALGVWEYNKVDETPFTAIPSPEPKYFRGRKEGGGRFDFKTKELPELKVGDRIEYYVEVHDTRPDGKAGTSEVRVKEVVDTLGLTVWMRAKLDEFKRLQQIEARQSGLFGPPR